MPAPPGAPPPQTFPYDYLFKVLIIGDASVGKVSFGTVSVSLGSMAISFFFDELLTDFFQTFVFGNVYVLCYNGNR